LNGESKSERVVKEIRSFKAHARERELIIAEIATYAAFELARFSSFISLVSLICSEYYRLGQSTTL
jgi:hypothetical protein